jgi:protein-tyrosine phosphatase
MRRLVEDAKLSRRIVVESAGTADYHTGALPDPRSREAARGRGLSLTSRARQFVAADWSRFDYVLAMDERNYAHLGATAPDALTASKLRLLRDFDPSSPRGASVPDPYHGGEAGFEEVLDLCEAACAGLLAQIRRDHRL